MRTLIALVALVALTALVACAPDNTMTGIPDASTGDARGAPDVGPQTADAPEDASAPVDGPEEAATDAPADTSAPPVDTGCPEHAARTSSGSCRCVTGFSLCGNRCVDLWNDPTSCGSCGAVCEHAVCALGRCVAVAPPVDAGSDACVSTTPTNCCGVACAVGPGASAATCVSGVCGVVCRAGFADCNGNPSDGCEVELAINTAHCGACGRSCNARTCRNGACT